MFPASLIEILSKKIPEVALGAEGDRGRGRARAHAEGEGGRGPMRRAGPHCMYKGTCDRPFQFGQISDASVAFNWV
jgi:hypothetical protein